MGGGEAEDGDGREDSGTATVRAGIWRTLTSNALLQHRSRDENLKLDDGPGEAYTAGSNQRGYGA